MTTVDGKLSYAEFCQLAVRKLRMEGTYTRFSPKDGKPETREHSKGIPIRNIAEAFKAYFGTELGTANLENNWTPPADGILMTLVKQGKLVVTGGPGRSWYMYLPDEGPASSRKASGSTSVLAKLGL